MTRSYSAVSAAILPSVSGERLIRAAEVPSKPLTAAQRWREENRERCRELERRWRTANADRNREHKRRWVAKNHARQLELTRDWKRRHPEWRQRTAYQGSTREQIQRRAQSRVQYAIKKGRLVRPSTCERCGATGVRIQAAHFDYSQPLQVAWLCCYCHNKWDQSEPKTIKAVEQMTVSPSVPD